MIGDYKVDNKDFTFIEDKNQGKIVKINNVTKEIFPCFLLDLNGYSNGDLLIYKDLLFVLLGEYLYGVNNSMFIHALADIKDNVKKISFIDYVEQRTYRSCKNNMFNQEEFLKEILRNSCIHFINKEIEDPLERDYFQIIGGQVLSLSKDYYVYKLNNEIHIQGYDENLIWRDIRIIKKDEADYDDYIKKIKPYDDYDAIDEEYEKHSSNAEFKKQEEEDEKWWAEYEKEKENKWSKYTNEYGELDTIVNRIIKNGSVKKQLLQGLSLLNGLLFNGQNNIFINGINRDKNKTNGDNSFVNGIYYDYSFLIINFVKAVETFFSYKMSKLPGEITIIVPKKDNSDKKERRNVKLTSEEFRKHAMLGEMINYLVNNYELFSDFYEQKYKDKFIEECNKFRNNCRNGYFHKDSVKSFDDAVLIINSSLNLLVGIELYLK